MPKMAINIFLGTAIIFMSSLGLPKYGMADHWVGHKLYKKAKKTVKKADKELGISRNLKKAAKSFKKGFKKTDKELGISRNLKKVDKKLGISRNLKKAAKNLDELQEKAKGILNVK